MRWRSTADDLGDKLLLLVGDVFLAAACISYMGAFTGACAHVWVVLIM